MRSMIGWIVAVAGGWFLLMVILGVVSDHTLPYQFGSAVWRLIVRKDGHFVFFFWLFTLPVLVLVALLLVLSILFRMFGDDNTRPKDSLSS